MILAALTDRPVGLCRTLNPAVGIDPSGRPGRSRDQPLGHPQGDDPTARQGRRPLKMNFRAGGAFGAAQCVRYMRHQDGAASSISNPAAEGGSTGHDSANQRGVSLVPTNVDRTSQRDVEGGPDGGWVFLIARVRVPHWGYARTRLRDSGIARKRTSARPAQSGSANPVHCE